MVPCTDLHVQCMYTAYKAGKTVEPLLKDTLNKKHHRNYLPTKDTKIGCPSVLMRTFLHLKSGQPLYSGHNSWFQCVLYEEVLLCTCVHIGSEFSVAVWLCSVIANSTIEFETVKFFFCESISPQMWSVAQVLL